MKAHWRICGIILLLVVLAGISDNIPDYVRHDSKRDSDSPTQGRKSKLAAELDEHIIVRKQSEVMREYRRVLKRLDEAAGKGFDVSHLKEEMPRALRLLRKGEFRYAKSLLNSIYVRIPRKREPIRIAFKGFTLEDFFQGITMGLMPSRRQTLRDRPKQKPVKIADDGNVIFPGTLKDPAPSHRRTLRERPKQ